LATVEIPDTAAAERASGSSFYTAMRILPRAQREAMFQIYSFCRQVDDIADSRGPRDERRRELDRWRADIDAIYGGAAPAARVQGLARAVREFGLKREDFHAVIDGMEMDVIADIRAPDNSMLDTYCNRVASAVGRLSVRVFGMEEAPGIALAHHLGRALQLTNILRDLDEDAAAFGRLYLPAEALRAAGIATTEPAAVLASPALGKVCAHLVERARSHFVEADTIMARSPRRAVRAPRIMAEAYRLILERLVARGWSPPRQRVRIPKSRLVWIIMRHAFI
jgi:presqualene diphosphate synthase